MGSTPNWTYGYVPTAAEWNTWWSNKQDNLGYIPLNIAGGQMTGPLKMAESTIDSAGLLITPGVAPGTPQDGETWVDASGMYVQVNGGTIGPLGQGDTTVTWQNACLYAATAALPANTYANGTAGVGATLTGNSNGALLVDGYVPNVGDRILVPSEAAASHDGIYTVTTIGTISAPYVLTRATDYDTAAEILPGTAVAVNSGLTLASTSWLQTLTVATVGTDSIHFNPLFGISPLSIRQKLTTNTIWYVRPDGSDSNTGTANTSSGAWLTLQHADNWLRANVDPSGFTVTVDVADGTYTAGITTKGSGFVINYVGNTGTPGNVLITAVASLFIFREGAQATFNGFKCVTSNIAYYSESFALVKLSGNNEFGACTFGLYAERQGRIEVSNAVILSGNQAQFSNGNLMGMVEARSVAVTAVGTVATSTYFIQADAGMQDWTGSTFTGTFTGRRFFVNMGGTIITNNGGPHFFPGTVEGTNDGGYYR